MPVFSPNRQFFNSNRLALSDNTFRIPYHCALFWRLAASVFASRLRSSEGRLSAGKTRPVHLPSKHPLLQDAVSTSIDSGIHRFFTYLRF